MILKRFTVINPRLLTIFFLGIASGLPLALSGSALQAWFTVSGLDIVAIGSLALLGQPYVYKFIWAPLLDRYIPPFLGRRRGWIMLMQVLLALFIFAMAFFDPASHPMWLALFALMVSATSATQDVAIDAYRTEVLEDKERGMGAAYTAGGYRVGMLISGAMAFIIADNIGWSNTYRLMAVCMLLSTFITFCSKEPDQFSVPRSLQEALIGPFKEFFKREYAIAIIVFIVLYKLGDAFVLSLNTPFLLKGLGFSLTDVGLANKTVGLGASILGVFLGGLVMSRISLYRSLLYFGFLQAISNLLYMWLAVVGKNFALMVFAIFGENLCGGLGTAATVALLMALCNRRYTAAQFALLSAVSAIGRVFAGPMAGLLVEHIGWTDFYFITFVIALPGLVLLLWLQPRIKLVPALVRD